MNGFLLIDKETGWTSRDVCNRLQHLFHTKKVGHNGTLDPFATGLLLVSLGEATKCIPYLESEDKEYIASLTLGRKTNTGDVDGETIKESKVPLINKEDILKVFSSLLGKQEQIPPMTSAVHINGQKLYKLAHQGIEVDRQPRIIEIKKLDLLSFQNNIIVFKCLVSKGTYIRTLGETIAEKLGSIGFLDNLRRTKIGSIDIKNAKKINDISEKDLFSISQILMFPNIEVDEKTKLDVMNGKPLKLNHESDYLLITSDNMSLAIYRRDGDSQNFKCERGLWSNGNN